MEDQLYFGPFLPMCPPISMSSHGIDQAWSMHMNANLHFTLKPAGCWALAPRSPRKPRDMPLRSSIFIPFSASAHTCCSWTGRTDKTFQNVGVTRDNYRMSVSPSWCSSLLHLARKYLRKQRHTDCLASYMCTQDSSQYHRCPSYGWTNIC